MIEELPVFIDMEPSFGCNLRCRMCHVSYMNKKPRYLDLDRVVSWEGFAGRDVSLGAVYEPTIHPGFNDLIGQLNDLTCRVSMVTNAKNLNKKEIGNIFDSQLGRVTFSFDGARRETYEYIRRRGAFDQTVQNIRGFIENAHKRGKVSPETAFVVNFTANTLNMGEIKDAVALWSEIGVDSLTVIAMVERFDEPFFRDYSLKGNLEPFVDALESAADLIIEEGLPITLRSPYFSDLNADIHRSQHWMAHRVNGNIISSGRGRGAPHEDQHRKYNYCEGGMPFADCAAPYRSTRIDFDGNVNVCQKLKIGNIYEQSLADIWGGAVHKGVIDAVRASDEHCAACDYYRFCVRSDGVRYSDELNFLTHRMIAQQ